MQIDLSQAENNNSYTLDNKWEKARERLQRLEDYSNPYTFQQLEQLKIQKGWNCLDAGAGYGGVTRWLADKVGDEGNVDSLDQETVFLEEIHQPNVHVFKRDLITEPLPQGNYDLVFARHVLMHLPERAAVIKKLVSALKPGGILMVEDLAMFPDRFKHFSDQPEVSETASTLYDLLTHGQHMSFLSAYDNPEYFEKAKLTNVKSESYAPYLKGGSQEGHVMYLSMVQLKPLFVEKLGVDSLLYEKARQQYLEKSARWWGLSRVVTTGIKPL